MDSMDIDMILAMEIEQRKILCDLFYHHFYMVAHLILTLLQFIDNNNTSNPLIAAVH